MPNFKELSFKSLTAAQAKQKEMKKLFGYSPSVLKVRNPATGTTKFVIVKPFGLKRLR